MSQVIKIYQLLKDTQLATCFMVNGSPVSVTFQYGMTRPYLVRGRFSTNNKDLQAAIEADNSFNILFYLEQTITEGEPEKEAEIIPAKAVEVIIETGQTELETVVTIETIVTTDAPEVVVSETKAADTITDYPEVTNLQEARQKMFDLFPGEFKPNNLPNKSAVINRAKEKQITFSKLV